MALYGTVPPFEDPGIPIDKISREKMEKTYQVYEIFDGIYHLDIKGRNLKISGDLIYDLGL